jgi:hypothetical protein
MEQETTPANRDCGCNLIPRAKKPEPNNEAEPFPIRTTTSTLTQADRRDHFLARWGYKRNEYLVEPGLYKLGDPAPESPVFVSANYTLSFDALRSALDGVDGYILVLNTYGINVWCAAGKGTFGTDELVRRIEAANLGEVVSHRKLILPQLGAPGVAAHEVKKQTGFKVEYGPVRAPDLPEYLRAGEATPEMRRVQFPLRDRMVLIPVELMHVLVPLAIAAIGLDLLVEPLAGIGAVVAVLAGVVLFPILLPWLPTRDFSSKGLILGGLVALPVALAAFLSGPDAPWWLRAGAALMYLLALPPVTAFLALNFTGATTFTSKTGVRREMFAYIPVMAWLFGGGLVLTIAVTVIRLLG